jgi:hypothetical protein
MLISVEGTGKKNQLVSVNDRMMEVAVLLHCSLLALTKTDRCAGALW